MSPAHKFFTFLDLIAIAGLAWLANYYANLFHLVNNGAANVDLYTGLSLFILLLALPFLHVFVWFEKKYGLTQLSHKVANTLLAVSLVGLFFVSFYIDHKIEKMIRAHGYEVCKIKQSRTGRFIDYSLDSTTCIK
ncbi:hypothetical protein [Aurantivibrio plasticivorans]